MKQLPILSRFGHVLLCLFITLVMHAQDPSKSLKKQATRYSPYQAYKLQKLFDNTVKGYSLNKKEVGEDVKARLEYEQRMLVNPYTGELPTEIFEKEVIYASQIEDYLTPSGRKSKKWKKRGPFNVGGRTRALAIDRTNEQVILAGGVSGGLWRSEDQGQSWRKITRKDQHPSITCIVQDPRPGFGHIWYYGTGEGIGNSASASGAFYQGNGIFRSIDGGVTFDATKNTQDDDPINFSPFDIVTNIAVDPENGDVYVSTRDGVHRSTDQAENFTEVLAGGFPNWTEVIITTGGTFYAAIESTGFPNAGIFTSSDGVNWTNITPAGWSFASGRTVLGFAPSSENIVYAFSEDQSGDVGFLWEYDANNPINPWIDLTANLPRIGGPAGSLNTQGAYNLVVRVHPTNPNLVFVGGTNLYRSFNAFRTPAQQDSWIGGYSQVNNFSLYPNHHPDQHELLFFPSNPNRALCGNDGGVYLAEDITEINPGIVPVNWTDLNQGYLTTQPYTVAFDPEAKNEDLLSGFQDNGTWFTNSSTLEDPWIRDFGGDGSYAAIADGGSTRYVSAQFANIYRINFDEDGQFDTFTRVTPFGPFNFAFITPFILDPRNDNVMYLPAGNQILRNNNLDGIPLFSTSPTDVNWVAMDNSLVPGFVTSLDISTYPEANKLYYGTDNGGIYRIDNANIDASSAVDLSTGKGLPPGNVICITVDPNDSDRVFAVFSNYGIPSIFYTKNAGETWTDISGNLEENPDGSGSGPSVRWLAVQGEDDGYYIGTSTGLYFAEEIKKKKQRWKRVNRAKIGETVVAQVKTRKDGFVAVATHGNGLYSAFDEVDEREEPELLVAYLLDDYSVDINAADTVISIKGLFTGEDGDDDDDDIRITLTNSNPELVTATLKRNRLRISYQPDMEGVASIGVIATSDDEQVAEGFVINVSEIPIYEQLEAEVGSLPSQNFIDFGSIVQCAADVTVPEGQTWTIDRLLIAGRSSGDFPEITSATVVIYEDADGVPGAEVYNSGELEPNAILDELFNTNLDIELPSPVILENGIYWVSTYANLPQLPDFSQWFWSVQGVVVEQEGLFRDQEDFFGLGAVDWTSTSVLLGTVSDQRFQLFGFVSGSSGVAQERSQGDLLAESTSHIELKIWPNPSATSFSLNFSDFAVEAAKEVVIYDLKGNVIVSKVLKGGSKDFVWDAASQPTGLYLIKVKIDEDLSKVYSVLKR